MHNFNLNTKLLDEFCLNSELLYEFELKYELLDEFELYSTLAHLVTDAATGQTYLFEGGYFRRDGVFTRTGSFKRR